MKKQIGRGESLTIFLCWLVYTAAYVGRYNFVAYLEPIRDQIGAQKEALGLVTTFFSISYGAGQLVHGILSRKYNTRFSVTVALLGSAAVNAAMTVCPDAAAMKYVWLVNGAFQAILWSSLIKTLSDRLSDQTLPKAIVVMSSTAALGTFLAYGMSVLFSWRSVPYRVVFFVPAVLMALPSGARTVLMTLVALAVVQQADNMIISPRVMSAATGLHPALVLAAITVGGSLSGVAGMLFSVPALLAARCVARNWPVPYKNI